MLLGEQIVADHEVSTLDLDRPSGQCCHHMRRGPTCCSQVSSQDDNVAVTAQDKLINLQLGLKRYSVKSKKGSQHLQKTTTASLSFWLIYTTVKESLHISSN